MLILTLLLSVTFLASYALQRWRIRILHESVIAIVLGMIAGITISHTENSAAIRNLVTFDHSYFFNLLLPPIILHSGYDLKPNYFFQNLGSILVFAFAGTLVSSLVIGVLLFMVALTGLHALKLTFLDCMMFGAILSSTDPVTILAIFNQLQVDPKLYAIVFGESMLNDAVAIVLFRTLGRFEAGSGSSGTFSMIMQGVGSFFGVFMGSCIIGVGVALLIALLLRFTDMHRFPATEACFVTLMAYTTYLLSNSIDMSGIVSLLFCGMTMKHYVYPNLSKKSRQVTKSLFQIMAHLSENFIFIYLGLTIFTSTDEAFRWALILFTFIFILIGRAVSVFPMAWLINTSIIIKRRGWTDAKAYLFRRRFRRFSTVTTLPSPTDSVQSSAANSESANFGSQSSDQLIPRSHQIMIWWAGLRGAIAFALSMDIKSPSGKEVRTTTLVVVVLSILFLGGTTTWALNKLRIRTGVVPDDGQDSDSDNDGERNMDPSQRTRYQDLSVDGRNEDQTPQHHWFLSFDKKYLKPLFTRQSADISMNSFPKRGTTRRPRRHSSVDTAESGQELVNNNNVDMIGDESDDALSDANFLRDRTTSNSSDLGRLQRDRSPTRRKPWTLAIATGDSANTDSSADHALHRIPPPPKSGTSSLSSLSESSPAIQTATPLSSTPNGVVSAFPVFSSHSSSSVQAKSPLDAVSMRRSACSSDSFEIQVETGASTEIVKNKRTEQ